MTDEAGRFRQARQREQAGEISGLRRDGLIPVHWLHTHAYCEYQIYLEKVQGLEAPPTQAMLAGASQHALLDREHEKKAELDLTVGEAAAKATLEAVSLISRDVTVKGGALYGRIDEVVFEPARIVIIDDKPAVQPYFSNKLQVWGYCHAFAETYAPAVPLFGALRQEDTGGVVWLEEFRAEHSDLVTATVERIRAVLSGSHAPQPSGNSRKCRPCRFKASCPACAKE